MVDMTLKPGSGKADKLMRDALLAVSRQDPNKLKRVSEKLWDLAEQGDTKAYAIIADRIDGKPVQQIVADVTTKSHEQALDELK